MNRLKHIHLTAPHNPISYSSASELQDILVRHFISSKSSPDPSTLPRPTVFTMEMKPVYSFGRRQQQDADSLAKVAELKQKVEDADQVFSMRGGQTTYHGPGQLVAYPVIDLKTYKMTAKCYVRALERSAIELLERFGLHAKTTENTGVWLTDQEKIASIGVHMRRHITSHGIAINAFTNLSYFDYIVACGLPEAQATSIKKAAPAEWDAQMRGVDDPIRELGATFTQILDHNLHNA
ncbi:hypothetical protein V1512DRAFT_268271 [Lipomyces arxii]|uniref:uncharacterized protein n=1 Tax=Lipomyces arxii TaxID=56418 RepID=UPI0034CFBBAC